MGYAISTAVSRPFDETVQDVRAALQEQGFGVLTEIDLAATLKEKLDADIPPHLVLGACRPQLALAALQAEPSMGVLLPCNVAIRAIDAEHTMVEALDPDFMVELMSDDAIKDVATDARHRITQALDSLSG